MKKRTMMGLAAPVVLATGVAGISEQLYRFAFNRVNKVPETSKDKQKYADAYYAYVNWLREQPTATWYLHEEDASERLAATYLAADEPTTDTVIISHGYKGNGETMASYAKMFHQLGYNVLLPDDRAHGKSAGRYITFGWLDRLDYLDWINRVIEETGRDARIVLFGVSMGGATVEMMSGETLPEQVRCIIADCGYSSIDDELVYLLKRNFHLPKYPFLPAVNAINRHKQGFNLNQVSSVTQLKHNKRPVFFIHGEKDIYVPAEMLAANYDATQGPKEKWIVKDATHAESFWIDPETYKQHIAQFLNEYLTYKV
ncbi:MAG TPA: alpha/beta hydrolase [Lactobacillus sp.]|nr:alpha/beta hydrolase [Lactobacillus sp.]